MPQLGDVWKRRNEKRGGPVKAALPSDEIRSREPVDAEPIAKVKLLKDKGETRAKKRLHLFVRRLEPTSARKLLKYRVILASRAGGN